MARQARYNVDISTYNTWLQMKGRCDNLLNPSYKNYGRRGIAYEPRWKYYENFILDMGIRPKGLQLERLDNDKGYCKANCVWATKTAQARNRRNVLMSIELARVLRQEFKSGRTKREICLEYNVKINTLNHILSGRQWRE